MDGKAVTMASPISRAMPYESSSNDLSERLASTLKETIPLSANGLIAEMAAALILSIDLGILDARAQPLMPGTWPRTNSACAACSSGTDR